MTNRRALLSLLGRAGLAAGAFGLVVAAHAVADDGTIHGCYQKNNGQLRIGTDCRPSEIAISWNVQGPQGPKGDPGKDGAAGAPGVSGLERVHFSSVNDSESRKDAFAKCPKVCAGGTNAGSDCLADSDCPGGACSASKHVVGGGAQVFIGEDRVLDGPIAIKKSWPSDGKDGWAATAEEIVPTDLRWHVTAYALCANVAP